MTSTLASLAKVVFSSKTAAARSAIIVGPLQKIFGRGNPSEEEPLEEEQMEEILESSSVVENSQETGTGIFSALVAPAAAATGQPSAGGTVVAPVENPFVQRELRDFQRGYYRRAIAGNAEEEESLEAVIQDPDLSVPVGDEYLYRAQ